MTVSLAEGRRRSRSMELWDLVQGVMDWRLWAFLGLQDIRQRYRRSVLGPFWLTLGLGATVIGIGLLYSQILHTQSRNYLPYISISLLIWNFQATVLNESTNLFQGCRDVITSVKIPYTSFIMRLIARNLIVAAHSIAVVVVVFIWYRYPVAPISLVSLLGVLLVCVNLYWMALLISLASARYRDVAQIFFYGISIAFFLTPVIWMPSALRPGSPFVRVNPLAQLIEVVRAPVFSHTFPVYSYAYVTLMAVLGLGVALFVFYRSRKSLAYWI